MKMDRKKVQAILDWAAPTKVIELRSFLGLANYYRKFMAGYSKKAAPLIDLLKKNQSWVWTERCQEAFEGLKVAVSTKSMLKLSDYMKPFEVHTNASDKAAGGVIVADALSLKSIVEVAAAISSVEADFTDKIWVAAQLDKGYQKLLQ
uniref:Uncharacterized protein LOC109505998 n=1 Tax=Elaeis guineensis var. tenera TaxID=51953 RepID=A0A6J0PK49_ELAGV|nr:uncharacterized protein LOC109505998 [Elaeis guineensis]